MSYWLSNTLAGRAPLREIDFFRSESLLALRRKEWSQID